MEHPGAHEYFVVRMSKLTVSASTYSSDSLSDGESSVTSLTGTETIDTEKCGKKSDVTSETDIQLAEAEEQLSPWQQWMVAKTIEERRRRHIEQYNREEETKQRALERQEDEEKQKKCDVSFQRWLEEKSIVLRARHWRKQQSENAIKAENELKHAIIRSKSEQKFVEWIARKRENDDKKQLEMVKQAAEKEDAAFQRHILNEQAYNEWLASKRHGRQSYELSFYNPLPWHDSLPRRKQTIRGKRLVDLPASPPSLFKAREKQGEG